MPREAHRGAPYPVRGVLDGLYNSLKEEGIDVCGEKITFVPRGATCALVYGIRCENYDPIV